MKMDWKTYCSLTVRQLYLAIKGFDIHQVKKFEHTRMIAWHIYASIPGQKKHQSIYNYWPLPTDEGFKSVERNSDFATRVREKYKAAAELIKQKQNG